MALVHPVLGTITILFSVWVMSRGLIARRGTKASTAARRIHRKWAPWALGGMVLSGATGLASTVWLRDDLTVGETWHLAVGCTAIASMGAAGLATRAFSRDPRLRTIHPWIGVVSVVVAIAQGILGIELLP
ncbi:MAG: DUF4079 family protein [Myxococcota bacterium]